MLNDIKKQGNKTQVQISEDLGCSIIHTSNVNKEKSNYSLEKIIKLINSDSYCLDDYVELEGKVSVSATGFDREKFVGINQNVVKALFQFIQTYIQISQNAGEKEEKTEYLNEDLAKIAGEKVRHLRKEKGIRPEKIAQELYMKEGSYRNMENGSTGTTLENYIRIAKILEVPVSVIFEDALEDKSVVLQFELKKAFAGLHITGVRKYNELLDELLAVIRKYSNKQ